MEKQNHAIASLKRRVAFRMKGLTGLCFHNWKTNFLHWIKTQREVSPLPILSPPSSSLSLALTGERWREGGRKGEREGGREGEALCGGVVLKGEDGPLGSRGLCSQPARRD